MFVCLLWSLFILRKQMVTCLLQACCILGLQESGHISILFNRDSNYLKVLHRDAVESGGLRRTKAAA